MGNANFVLFVIAVIVFVGGYFIGRASIPKISGVSEGFDNASYNSPLGIQEEPVVEGFDEKGAERNECVPDSDKYVLRSSVPPCTSCPDMSKYILKSEILSLPAMSKYVLKSSVPKCAPCVCANAKPARIGACPPPKRCPVCPPPPEPKPCPSFPDVVVKPCDQPKINCKADYTPENAVKPSLASMSGFGF